ncbi:MAG: type transport system permease protein [Clostridiales bacterium]|jgi:ABC-2 type transport system permease protein|nr:type transport system permease protein [Clostridiales bacterium]MDK2933300.1 type transport system permease protein [Clostridiales bacterium]
MGMGQTGLGVLYRKELADHIKSKRFVIILLLVAVTGLGSAYSAAQGIQQAIAQEGNKFVFLRLFTSSGGSLPSFLSFISFLGPLIGLALGFDGINGERSRGTLSRLLAQPIHRDAVVNGKFLAGITVLAVMLISLGLAVGGLGIIMIGIPPTFEELMRILIFIFFTIVYMSLWLAISLLFSLLFRQTATSALAGIALWLFLAVFLSLLAGLVADGLFPINDQASISTAMYNQQVRQNLSRLSPTQLYDEATVTILNPGVRTLGPILPSQLEGAIPGILPLGQSLLLIWPHLTGLIAINMICFTIAYIYFMKQEIRAG